MTPSPRKCGHFFVWKFGQTFVSRPTFILTLQPRHDGVDEIKALRFVLKRLLRQHGLRCVTLRELAADETNQNTHTDFPPSARAR
jgi:hypothetical protein